MSELFLSVVVPVYNEERCIADSIQKIQAFLSLKDYESELIVFSDGSTDKTNLIVSSLKSTQKTKLHFHSTPNNTGKGFAVRQAVLVASGKYILLSDADLSAPIKEVDKLVAAIESGVDMAVGSRAVRVEGCDVQQTFKRWFAGRIFNFFVQLLVIRGIYDTQCGFKCFSREAGKKIFSLQKIDGFSFDVEILYLAKKLGYRIKEVPVMWKEVKESHVSLFKDSILMFRSLFQIKRDVRLALERS